MHQTKQSKAGIRGVARMALTAPTDQAHLAVITGMTNIATWTLTMGIDVELTAS
tara:strand:- start:918 stop:1079 length:162 start_codon:yes stop_codon:yes gene_type:complete